MKRIVFFKGKIIEDISRLTASEVYQIQGLNDTMCALLTYNELSKGVNKNNYLIVCEKGYYSSLDSELDESLCEKYPSYDEVIKYCEKYKRPSFLYKKEFRNII